MRKVIGIIAVAIGALFAGLVARVGAGMPPTGAPEIDPGVASSAIGLLVCGVLMLTARRRRK